MNRQFNLIDDWVVCADNALRTLFGTPLTTGRPYPADEVPEASLTEEERKQIAGLMRVNHAGEVSAQGLYQGQALTARNPEIRQHMQQSALEENDHLDWCERRLTELNSHTSYVNSLWYFGSFCIGATAGFFGDSWSLGFVEETEYQVMEHLDNHLQQIPKADLRSRKIIEQLKTDEAHHAHIAKEAGSIPLPPLVKGIMGSMSKIMTKTAYWI